MSLGKKRSGFQITSVTSDYQPSSPVSPVADERSASPTPTNGLRSPPTSRFRVVRLDQAPLGGGRRYKRGRWSCVEFYHPEVGSTCRAGAGHSLDSGLPRASPLRSPLLLSPGAGGKGPQAPRSQGAPVASHVLPLPESPCPPNREMQPPQTALQSLSCSASPRIPLPPPEKCSPPKQPCRASHVLPLPESPCPPREMQPPPNSPAEASHGSASPRIPLPPQPPPAPQQRNAAPAKQPYRASHVLPLPESPCPPAPNREMAAPPKQPYRASCSASPRIPLPPQPPNREMQPLQTALQSLRVLPLPESPSLTVSFLQDLVKTHLLFAVREVVEILKEQIKDLTERNSHLEHENSLLRSLATPQQLSELPTPRLRTPWPRRLRKVLSRFC
uniref:TSC22 domain family member 4 n=1 Tax=Xenopus tropicalis TaxID=8364 RepID=A0A803KG89_XENTR